MGFPPRRLLPLVPLVVALAILSMLFLRWSHAPIDVYGEEGAEYIEHFDRIRTLQIWRANSGDPLGFLVAADNAYPPLLHALTLPVGALSGHSAEQVVWSGACWYLLLALGIGLCGWALVEERWGLYAGITGGLLFPAGHAAASRYYYDLPMTALLWLGLGLALLLAPRRPLLGGVLGGVLTAAAALIKWTALPFAAPMLLAAAVTPRIRPARRKLLALGLCLGFVLPTGGYLSQSSRSWTEMMSTFGPETNAADAMAGAASRTLSRDPWLQAPDRGDRSGGRVERAVYYASSLATAMYSPLVFLLVLGLSVLWVRRRGPGGWLVGLIVGGQGLFVVAAVPPLDERFILTLAPTGILTAILGWRVLPRSWQAGVAAAAVVGGLAVAADFHLREVDPEALRPDPEVGILAPSAGLGLNSSWEQRGWGRSDRSRLGRLSYRERLWAQVEEARAQEVGIIGGPLIDPFGDTNWWHYRALLGEVEGTWGRQGALHLIELCQTGDAPQVDIVIASDTRVGSVASPWCPAAGAWQPGRRVAGDDQHRGAVVWLPAAGDAQAPPPEGGEAQEPSRLR